MRWRSVFILILLYFVYLLIGAAVFWSLEYTNEEQLCAETISQLEEFNLTSSGVNVTTNSQRLRLLVEIILKAQENGVQFNSNLEPSCAHNWDYQRAFFFAGTVITTIGYGHIAPTTSGGRVFCIFFAAIGLPIFAIMFSAIGEKFANLFKRVEAKLQMKISNPKYLKVCVVLFLLSCLIVFGLLIPASIFMAVEDWTYQEAFYYAFITLTTIGFGDFVVGNNPDKSYIAIYRVAVYFWILFGLAFMATVISIVSEMIQPKAQIEEDSNKNSVEADVPEITGDEAGIDNPQSPANFTSKNQLDMKMSDIVDELS